MQRWPACAVLRHCWELLLHLNAKENLPGRVLSPSLQDLYVNLRALPNFRFQKEKEEQQ